ncbi:tetratricopeptide repeat protein [Sporobolomyces salmoneus]|uniref:tetratricopeptide repeat protein n=1 Tax=Sporobolomyces salmoneus TaxID=183962 RepID=UPI00316BDA48
MQAHPIHSPYNLNTPLTAPRAQPPPSQIPTERLTSTAERWSNGTLQASPTPPPSLNPLNQSHLQPQMYPQSNYARGGLGGGGNYGNVGSTNGQGHLSRPQSYSVGSGYPSGSTTINSSHSHSRPASFAATPNLPPNSYGQFPVPPPPQNPYTTAPPPQMNPYFPPGPPGLPPTTNQGYLAATPNQQPQHVGRPPRVASMQPQEFNHLQQGMNGLSLSGGSNQRVNYYASPEEGPPHKLSVTHPDQKMLASMREAAHQNGGDVSKKVAWAKQVLKFIERTQAAAGESSRISDPTLVRWTDEALNHILTSASSSSPVPLALYLRGDLSASGSFPSYRSKDAKSSFRDFEAAANSGYVKSWFRIGRAYEDFGDIRRAVGAYEKGVEKGDCGSTYRLAMAYLLGQIGVNADVPKAMALLKRAADTADLDTPQPPYILGMLLSGEFDSPSVQLNTSQIPLDLDEAQWRIERAAYLSFGPAQYKMGFSYEYATLGCLFDPLLSVQYYALASQNGEVEADMALSKWYLCGSEGNFEKNEALAVTFAEKAAARSLPSAEFALGYFREVGINGSIDLEQAKRWYQRAASHGNDDAKKRLDALDKTNPELLNRTDHDQHVDTKLVRKRTAAKIRSDEQRERIAASKLAASLAGPPDLSGPPPPPPQLPLQQQQQYQGPPLPQQPSYNPGRQSVTSVASGNSGHSSTTLRRKNTQRQVEAAARMGQQLPMGSNGRATPSIPQNSAFNGNGAAGAGSPSRASYRLSDAPPSNLPTTQRPNPLQQGGGMMRPIQEIKVANNQPQRAQPSSFAEMGITTTKAKKDDCSIM